MGKDEELSGVAGDSDAHAPERGVRCEDYGMNYDPKNADIVKRGRCVADEKWNELPVERLCVGTNLEANEEWLKQRSIEKVVSGTEPLREGYVVKIWRDESGKLHVVDGHHRVAMHYALSKPLPVRIMDEADYCRLMGS